jgi:hypothetical protein
LIGRVLSKDASDPIVDARFDVVPDMGSFAPIQVSSTECLAGSTGQRNTVGEHFCGGTGGQRLSGPLVQ